MDIRLEGLSEEQVELLDIMWSFDSSEDFLEWKYTLNQRLQMQVEVLVQLLGYEIMEREIQAMDSYPDAKKMLKKFVKKT